MDINEFIKLYWNYYKQLEEDFFSTNNYCSIDVNNGEAFSIKYQQLILSIGSELDVICKEICKLIKNEKQDKNDDTKKILDVRFMKDYKDLIFEKFPTFQRESISIWQFGIQKLMPWQNFDPKTKKCDWWETYNTLKHNRTTGDNYKKANQKTTLNILCALYITIEYLAYLYFKQETNGFHNTVLGFFSSDKLNMDNWKYESFEGRWLSVALLNKYFDNSDNNM